MSGFPVTLLRGPLFPAVTFEAFGGRGSLRDSPVTFGGYVSDPAEGRVEKGDQTLPSGGLA